MYFYIINPQSSSTQLNKLEDQLKNGLEKLGIKGKLTKILKLDDIRSLTQNAINEGYKTLVSIGDDETFYRIVGTVLKSHASNIAVGTIPIGKNTSVAKQLGINNWKEALRILARRKLTPFYPATINNQLFINRVVIHTTSTTKRPMKFKAKLNEHIKLSGSTNSVEIINQFLTRPQQKELLIKFIHYPEKKRYSFFYKQINISQFHSSTAVLGFPEKLIAILNQHTLENDVFSIKQRSQVINFITSY